MWVLVPFVTLTALKALPIFLFFFPDLQHGGSTNAFTASEMTNYFFDVNTDCFEEALDRFAQFLIKPLMSADATMREIKAVDSENQKNLLSDAWRMNQVLFLFFLNHPLSSGRL
ncbi:insulin-degrading enzyme-like 1, peroxisomal isoform X5 [Gossypium raimondii]|uniref:insulin-degrading enzyme-like 1, peroxisomal isoform X5 n=1 Tax=Gossypium raimondii TaxID=29730 RepID=UPI00227BC607|nr:insulin-degrading enzyme-like 1, peroxisomal isoform X5 [Gossypium raimondii]